ncbi:MAG: MerR family DNA-binding transcriptional regulator, partial [Candidatus Zixiibacteriota bacterium]
MTIGRLAQESNTVAQTIRYYERLGLLSKPRRS